MVRRPLAPVSASLRRGGKRAARPGWGELVIGLIKRAGHSNAAKAHCPYTGHIVEAFGLLLSEKRLS